MGEEKSKSQEKKKRMKYESSLEYCGKRKRYYKVVQNEAKAQHEYLAYVTMCFVKSFEKFSMNLIMSLNSMKSLEPL